MRATWTGSLLTGILILAAAACSGSDAVLVGNSLNAASAAIDPPALRGIDGIPGWQRTGAPERYNREGLYGYIDGGAEIVLQYGFRELSVQRFVPETAPTAREEITLEIYRMSSGQAAFGLYSTKLEGGEKAWPGVGPDNWIGPGQAGLVKGEFMIDVLAPGGEERAIGAFLAAVEPKIPGGSTVRPHGLDRLPADGMIPSSGRYIKGPLAARNESPFLDGGPWGFEAAAGAKDATVAYSAKYGAVPQVSKLIVIELGKSVAAEAVDASVFAAFKEYLQGVRGEGPRVAGSNDTGRTFLYRRAGRIAVLVLGEKDLDAAGARLDRVLSPARR